MKEVSVERVSVSSHSSSISVSPSNSIRDTFSPIPLLTPSEISSQALSTPSKRHASPPSKSVPPRPCQSTPISSLNSYISSIEIDGLLTLLKKVQEENLFLTESPPDLSDPLSLAALLVSQLKSSEIQTVLATKPTGISLLQQKSQKSLKPESRKRKRPTLKVSIPGKYSRLENNSKTNPSTVDLAAQSQDIYCDCTILKIEKYDPVSCASECTCVSTDPHREFDVNSQCSIQSRDGKSSESPPQAVINLLSPTKSNEFSDFSPDDSAPFSRSVSPCSPFTLCIPCTPSQEVLTRPPSPSLTPVTPSL